MRVFDATKTNELTEYDLELGHLQNDKIVKEHHEATPTIEAVSAEARAQALQAGGAEVECIGDKWYTVDAKFENGGKIVTEIKPIEAAPAKEAWDEYEKILVYIPYTSEELAERELQQLRAKRSSECFPIINRGELWYDKLTADQRTELSAWYEAWLDVTETKAIPKTPDWVNKSRGGVE